MEGLREASGQLRLRNGQKPALLRAKAGASEPAMARSLYQSELSRNGDSYEADMPVQLVVKAALQNSFRCTH